MLSKQDSKQIHAQRQQKKIVGKGLKYVTVTVLLELTVKTPE